MAKQTINIGTTANDGTGDPIRSAFDKTNDNFTELYLDVVDLKIAVDGTSGDTIVANAVKGDVIGQDSSIIVDSVNAKVTASLDGDVTGSVFADDSTKLVDAVEAKDAVYKEIVDSDGVKTNELVSAEVEAKDAYTYMDIKDEATEGYTEKTRLGVRYSELLAFIISAI